MSATDELRRLLDEHGEKHCDVSGLTLWLKDGNHHNALAMERVDGSISLVFDGLTPEQAIDTTLGREKCRNIGYGLRFECSACHQTVGGETPNFCPNCGRAVVDD